MKLAINERQMTGSKILEKYGGAAGIRQMPLAERLIIGREVAGALGKNTAKSRMGEMLRRSVAPVVENSLEELAAGGKNDQAKPPEAFFSKILAPVTLGFGLMAAGIIVNYAGVASTAATITGTALRIAGLTVLVGITIYDSVMQYR